jgi:hypothetical protein
VAVTKAFVLAPLAVPVLYVFGALLLGGATGWSAQQPVALLMAVAGLATPAGDPAMALFGLPWYWVLSRLGLLYGWALIAGGLLFGALSIVMVWAALLGSGFLLELSASELARLVSAGAALGAGVGCCFSYMAGIPYVRRPGRSPP